MDSKLRSFASSFLPSFNHFLIYSSLTIYRGRAEWGSMTQVIRRAFAMCPRVPIFTLAPRLVPLWGRDSLGETPSSSRTASPAAERFTFRTPGNSNGQALWGNKPVPTDVIGPRGSEIVCPRQHPVVPAVHLGSQEKLPRIPGFLSVSSVASRALHLVAFDCLRPCLDTRLGDRIYIV